MIAKTKVTENIWEYFEARRIRRQIHYPETKGLKPVNDMPNIGVLPDVFNYTNRSCTEDEHDGGIVELTLYNERGDTRQILCYRPCYIMNDEGKTIERI